MIAVTCGGGGWFEPNGIGSKSGFQLSCSEAIVFDPHDLARKAPPMNRSVATLASICAVAGFLSCDDGSLGSGNGGKSTYGDSLPAPSFDPVGGTYASAQSVKLVGFTDGTIIHYTTDGSLPTRSSAVYSSPVEVLGSAVIRAFAEKGDQQSRVTSAWYEIGVPVSSTSPWNPSISYGSFPDPRNGRIYRTVSIGKRNWMAENLDFPGTTTRIGACYGNSPDSCAKYGRLYTWTEVMAGEESSTASPSGVQGICPSGWHVPSSMEWSDLKKEANAGSGQDGMTLRSIGGWARNGTDVFGFRALAGGYLFGGAAQGIGTGGNWWTATESGSSYAWTGEMPDRDPNLGVTSYSKIYGYSLRCVED